MVIYQGGQNERLGFCYTIYNPVYYCYTRMVVEEMRVNETRKRSLLKGLTQRVIEVAVDTLILSFFATPHIALTLAVIIELLCWCSHYANERLWNHTDYGREIK